MRRGRCEESQESVMHILQRTSLWVPPSKAWVQTFLLLRACPGALYSLQRGSPAHHCYRHRCLIARPVYCQGAAAGDESALVK